MAQTPIYLIDYPVSTDLVANGATAMQTLATNAEAAIQAQTAAFLTGNRNQLNNPTFSQNQLYPGAPPATGIADFWQYYADATTSGQSSVTNSLAVTAGIPEWVTNSLTNTVTANTAGVNRYVAIQQTITDVRSLSGASVVVSFYARAGAGTPKIGVNLTQTFGTGGTPSADVVGVGQSVTITTAFVRYSVTIAVASASGKTLGNSGTDGTILRLWTSAGSNFNSPSGSIGLQTSAIEISGVQVERTYLTPLEVRSSNSNWRQSSDFGPMQTFTPAITGVTTTIANCRYQVLGKTCWYYVDLLLSSTSSAGITIEVTGTGLPVARVQSVVTGPAVIKLGATFQHAVAIMTATTPRWKFYVQNPVTGPTANMTATFAVSDIVRFGGFYEIA